MFKRISVFKPTEDDWYPSYLLADANAKLVKITILEYPTMLGKFCVCAWGADDFGLQKEFDNLEEAKRVFETIIELNTVSIKQLIKLEFENA